MLRRGVRLGYACGVAPLLEARASIGAVVKRAFIKTFGCQMNVHDSRRIEEVLRADGYETTEAEAEADLLVLNTCSVREKAEQKLRSAVGRLKQLKRERPDVIVALAGCMAQEHGTALLDRFELVDLVVGPDNLAELPELVTEAQAGGLRTARTVHDIDAPRFLHAAPLAGQREVTAYVTTMKGCDERCTFCIVPYTRGPERYRPAADIIDEIRQLVAGGVREVTLLGQTVNSWHEPGTEADDGDSRFGELLDRIAREVSDLKRLRYTSPHPRHVTERLVRAHTELDLLPAHVHLPVQSGSDRLLKRMLRRYRRDDYVRRARALMRARPGFTLSTDIIVGFPGETEDDFQQTLSLVDEVGFVAAFGFMYSPRPHTPALKMDDDVAEPEKRDRLARLFERVDRLQQRHLQSLVGTQTQVLVEGRGEDGRFMGRSARHEIVHVDAPAGSDPTGLLVDARIDAAHQRALSATIVSPVPQRASGPARHHLPVVA